MKLSATIIRLNEAVQSGSKNFDSDEEEMLDITSAYTYILGRFARITAISHNNLCKPLELIKCCTVQNGFILVSEHYSQAYINHDSFLNIRIGIGTQDVNSTVSVAIQICSAMEFYHKNNIAVGSLDLTSVFVVDNNPLRIKLSQAGMCYIFGDYYHNIRMALNAIHYQPPEYLLNLLPKSDHSAYYWTDIWSFGIILIELFTGWRLTEILDGRQFLSILSSILFKKKDGSIYVDLLDAISNLCPAFVKKRHALDQIHFLIERCLNINPLDRLRATEIRKMLEEINNGNAGSETEMDVNNLDEDIEALKARMKNESELEQLGYTEKTLDEIFYLWKLCGSNVENILARKGAIKTRPPLSTLPSLMAENYLYFGNKHRAFNHSPISIFELPVNNLLERLQNIPYDKICISFEFQKEISGDDDDFNCSDSVSNRLATLDQSLVVKERDIEYQYQRMHLFRRLLSAWPNKADILLKEASIDIPPVYRGKVWSAILGVLPFHEDRRYEMFYELDTLSEHISDRQLQVDIPRCHQYDEMMSSPIAHYQMKLLLKALLISRKDEFVYWQGLDSLSAPFLILHFNDLPTAFRCLNAFIDRFLHGFFHKDNTTVIRSYLAEFMRVIEFCDTELFTHFISLDFHPELFAIPWFLTCFAHVLPLHKLFHLWDALLLTDAEFPLFIGVAILLQLRPRLITATFNEAILMFSDLPDLQIDNVVNCAKYFYNKWKAQEDKYIQYNA